LLPLKGRQHQSSHGNSTLCPNGRRIDGAANKLKNYRQNSKTVLDVN
jgi:hypothetical protein